MICLWQLQRVKSIHLFQCKTACELEESFVCRGFTWGVRGVRGERSGRGLCDLHSEDLVTAGSWLLRRNTDATYYRRVICLNSKLWHFNHALHDVSCSVSFSTFSFSVIWLFIDIIILILLRVGVPCFRQVNLVLYLSHFLTIMSSFT